jgi:hypothetical protein
VPTSVRAVAFRAGYLPSVSAVGNYVVTALPNNSLSLVRSISGNGTFLPYITISATPSAGVNCYAVTETVLPGLTPSGLAANAVWNPTNNTIYWGPFLDHQPRALTYQLSGPAGSFPLAGQGSFDGYPATVTGATTVTFNPAYTGEPTNYASCIAEPISYTVDIDPAPGIIVVDTASGTINWGDGTQTNITQPEMTLQKLYSTSGTYTITIAVNWTGHTASMSTSGSGTKTDTVLIVSSCNGPVILTQPTNQVVLAGTTVQFSINATSSIPMSFQWYYNRTNPIFSPSAFATLSLSNVTTQADGLYSVLVANSLGSTTSGVAKHHGGDAARNEHQPKYEPECDPQFRVISEQHKPNLGRHQSGTTRDMESHFHKHRGPQWPMAIYRYQCDWSSDAILPLLHAVTKISPPVGSFGQGKARDPFRARADSSERRSISVAKMFPVIFSLPSTLPISLWRRR